MEKNSLQETLKILLLAGSRTDPASRFRIWQFVEPLRRLGHDVTVRVPRPSRTWSSPVRNAAARRLHGAVGAACRLGSVLWNLRDATKFDVIMMNRDLVPDPNITFLEPLLAKRNPRLIFDFDDAIHLGGREAKLRRILPGFAWITPGNPYLAEFAQHLNQNLTVWPTVVDTDYYKPAIERPPGLLRIGWSGSNSTAAHCLPLLEGPISELAKTEQFELVVICNSDPGVRWAGVTTRFIPWREGSEVADLQMLDIGLMPLKDEPFERGKCGLKAIQYMGVGVPALVSPIGVNQEIVLDGITGFHCKADSDWMDRLRQLTREDHLVRKFGAAARTRTVARYSVQSLMPRMLETFRKVATVGRPA